MRCRYGEEIRIAEGIRIRFIDAGHLLGSSSIEVWVKEGKTEKKIVFSGDIGNCNQPLIRDPQYPTQADYVLMESTYGDRSHDAPADYATALAEKAAALRESGSAAAQELLDAEARIAGLEGQLREIREAADAGEAALNAAGQVLETLDSAEGWSTWDILGGGLLADLAKYEELDNAQEQVEQLQEKLRQFKTELADVTIEAELQVSVDGFLRFADFFFDGLFADLAVMEHINDSQEKIRSTQKEIQAVLERLTAMREEMSAALDRERERADRITVDTPL